MALQMILLIVLASVMPGVVAWVKARRGAKGDRIPGG